MGNLSCLPASLGREMLTAPLTLRFCKPAYQGISGPILHLFHCSLQPHCQRSPHHVTAARNTWEGSQVGSNHHSTLSTLQLGDTAAPWTNSELWEPCGCSKSKQTRNKAAVCPKSTSEHSTVLFHKTRPTDLIPSLNTVGAIASCPELVSVKH